MITAKFGDTFLDGNEILSVSFSTTTRVRSDKPDEITHYATVMMNNEDGTVFSLSGKDAEEARKWCEDVIANPPGILGMARIVGLGREKSPASVPSDPD